jgi:hypothetical protein
MNQSKTTINLPRSISKPFLFLSILFGICSCFSSSTNWNEFNGQGLRKKYEHFNDMAFLNEQIGFLAGCYISEIALRESNSLTDQDAIIYKTTDGGGSWKEYNLLKGSIESIEAYDDNVFALKRIFTENSFNNLKSVILKSINRGESWREIYSTDLPFHIMKLLFKDSQNGIALVQNQEKREQISISQTINGGESWNVIAEIDDFADFINVLFVDNNLYFLSLKPSTNVKGILGIFNLQTGYLAKKPLPDNLDARIITKDNHQNIWIAGTSDGTLALVSMKANSISNIPVPLSLSHLSPYSMHVYDSCISLFAVERGTVLGVTKKFFYSTTDLGVTWKAGALPSSLYIKPISYYGKGNTWAYSGGGTVQKRGDTVD